MLSTCTQSRTSIDTASGHVVAPNNAHGPPDKRFMCGQISGRCSKEYGCVHHEHPAGRHDWRPHKLPFINLAFGVPGSSAPNSADQWKKFGQAIKSCAAKSFLPAAAGAGALAAGSNVVSTAGKFAGSTPGTSIASQFFRAVLPQTIKSTWAPTLMNPLAESSVLGGVVGRWVPVVGEALLIKSGADFLSCVWPDDADY